MLKLTMKCFDVKVVVEKNQREKERRRKKEPFLSSVFVCLTCGVPRTHKKAPPPLLVGVQGYQAFSLFKPGVGQNYLGMLDLLPGLLYPPT